MGFVGYGPVVIEGGDQVGKGDAVGFFSEKMLSSGISIVSVSLPIYDTPIGNTIRFVLKTGGEELGLGPREDLSVRMVLFALNRLEILNSILAKEGIRKSLLVFDRGSFSNALTISYAISQYSELQEVDLEEIVDEALVLDRLIIKTLGLEDCVIELVNKDSSWEPSRSDDADRYENIEVQKLCRDVYSIFAKKVGSGWSLVHTREDGEWRKREDIFADIKEFVDERCGDIERVRNPLRKSIGGREVVKDLYLGSEVGEELLSDYEESVVSNDKSKMYSLSSSITEEIISSCDEVVFGEKEVRMAFANLLGRYPKVLKVLELNLGKGFADLIVRGSLDE